MLMKQSDEDDDYTIEDLFNDPVIKHLEEQKARNIEMAKGNSKRISSEVWEEKLAQDERYAQLKEQLRIKIAKLLAEGLLFSANNGESLLDHEDEKTEVRDKAALNRLWNLLKKEI